MTKIMIDNKPGIKAIAQIGIDDRYHFVCKNEVTGCNKYPWYFGKMQLSHRIDDYIRSLNLPTDENAVFMSIVNEPNHE